MKQTLTPEEIALFNKLKQHLGAENQKDISLTPQERVLLSEVRDKKEPGWTYKTPFIWDEIVVNTNWLSYVVGRTIVASLTYYKTLPPTINS